MTALRGDIRRGRAWTPRQVEVLRLFLGGLTVKELAARLHMSPRTVKFHLTNIYENLGVRAKQHESKRHALMNRFGRFEVSIRWVPDNPRLFPKLGGRR